MVAANTLPTPPTALVGRAADVAALIGMLTAPGTRLVTVTGPPGVGKTRLALAAAAALVDRFPDGTIWVDLAPIRVVRLVPEEIARALGVGRSATESAPVRLAAVLADRDILIVLDNCEHVLDAVSELGGLLAASPRLDYRAAPRGGAAKAAAQLASLLRR